MNEDIQKIYNLARSIVNSPALLKEVENPIQIMCQAGNEKFLICIYFEHGNFQIALKDRLVIDKVEDQDLSFSDVKPFVKDVLDNIQQLNWTLVKHSIGGFETYALEGHSGLRHTPYRTPTGVLLEKFGKHQVVGIISFEQM